MGFKKLRNQDKRRAGFEFELSNTSVDECADIIATVFGGTIHKENSLEAMIDCKDYGEFKVELDAQMVKDIVQKLEKKQVVSTQDIVDMNKINDMLSQSLGDISKLIVPFEIVTPPLYFKDFAKLEELVVLLREKNVKGTKAKLLNAFGMHINPEVPSQNVEDIRDILRAFILLYSYLKEKMLVDFARKVTPYIDPFPIAYHRLILDGDYQPTMDEFIADYLQYSPTRNRALDLLPLFLHIKEDALNGLKDAERKRVKARPTFHYRLPNCEIDNEKWTVAHNWNYWFLIEKIAFDKDTLRNFSMQYLALNNEKEWLKILKEKHL